MSTPDWIQLLSNSFPFLTKQWFGNEVWKYLFCLVYIFLAFYVSKFLDFLMGVWLRKWAEKTASKFYDLFLSELHGPVKIVVFVILLRIGLEVFNWPAFVQSVMTKVFTIIVAVALTYMALKLVDLLLGYWRQRTRSDNDRDRAFDEQLFPIIRKSLKLFVVVVAVLITLDNIGVNITAAIASLSIGGLAIGLAAQDTLANLFGGIAIFLDKPFRIGEAIALPDGTTGDVEAIGLRTTRVRNPDGYLIAIPNKTMGNATITNISRRPNIKTEFNFGLAGDTPVDQVKRALKLLEEIYRAHPTTEDLNVCFNKFVDSAPNINVVHWWKGTDGRANLAVMQELNLAVKERFEAEGIQLAFPARKVYLKQEAEGQKK
jgi:MscS family membrane protein